MLKSSFFVRVVFGRIYLFIYLFIYFFLNNNNSFLVFVCVFMFECKTTILIRIK